METCRLCDGPVIRSQANHTAVAFYAKQKGTMEVMPDRHYYHAQCYIKLLDNSSPLNIGRA